jgi:hypothetical protein
MKGDRRVVFERALPPVIGKEMYGFLGSQHSRRGCRLIYFFAKETSLNTDKRTAMKAEVKDVCRAA